MKSLSDSRDFHDPETASSSRLSHAPQSSSNCSEFFWNALPRCLPATSHTDLLWYTGKRFSKIHLRQMNRQQLVSDMCMPRSLRATRGEPVSVNTGRSGPRTDELERNTQNFAIPAPRIARKFSTWNPLSHAEGASPQKCMVEQPRNQASTFHCWKTSFKTEVCSCSDFLTGSTAHWIKEARMVESVDDLKSSQSIGGRRFPTFEMLDAKIASALTKIITNPNFKKRSSLAAQKAQLDGG